MSKPYAECHIALCWYVRTGELLSFLLVLVAVQFPWSPATAIHQDYFPRDCWSVFYRSERVKLYLYRFLHIVHIALEWSVIGLYAFLHRLHLSKLSHTFITFSTFPICSPISPPAPTSPSHLLIWNQLILFLLLFSESHVKYSIC